MPANVYVHRGQQPGRSSYQASRPGQPAQRDHVAPAMVREWSSAQRTRIRGILLELVAAAADPLTSPEMQIVAMIDQAASEAG